MNPALLLLCGLVAGAGDAAAKPFVLVRDGKSSCTVIAPKSTAELAKIALRDFLHYVKRATGNELRTLQTGQDSKQPAVELRIDARANLPRHAFRYRVTTKRLTITAADPGGLAKGVHWFLREKLGVRWFIPTKLGEEVPRHKTIKLRIADQIKAPEFEWLRMTGNQSFLPEEVMWGVRHGDDVYDPSVRLHWFRSHNWSHIVPPTKENVEKHPEWFAREEGQLPKLNSLLNVDVTNREVIAQFIKRTRAYFDADPRRVMFSIESNDTQYFGNSKPLKALRKKLGPKAISTDEYIWFCNQVAKEVIKTHPDKKLGFYAYGNHMFAPTVVKPHPMLSFMMCRHGGRSCARHSILDPNNHVNARWRKNFEAWCSMLKQPGYYGYWADYGWYGPTPLNRLAEDLPYLKRQKVHQLNSENRFSWSTNAPYYYLALRLTQDTRLNPAVVLDEFYRGMYGPASEPMRRYWMRWSKAWEAAPPRDNKGYHYEKTYSPQLVRAAYNDLREAKALVAQQPKKYRKRIHLAYVGLTFTDRYLRMYRQAAAKDYKGAIATGKEIEQIILNSAKLGRPAAFAMHPSSVKYQMSLGRLLSDVGRYKKALSQ